MVDRQSAQLVRIVDDMIDMARISRGTLTVERAPTELGPILAAALDTVRPLLERQRHHLLVEGAGDAIYINGDPHRLTQLFVNLLNNAARYTPPGGQITLRSSVADNRAMVVVADNGIGVDAAMHDRIFDMFVRGRAQKSSDSGLGVGLALSRRIAELHEGTVDVASEGSGRGATFTVRIPLASTVREQRPIAVAAPAGSRRRVLVVDDNEDAAEALDLMLRQLGHETLVLHRGQEALLRLAQFGPDVVLLDLGMPGLDGFEVARRIRATHLDRQPTVIAVTGWGQDADRERARAAGFDAHLVKPVSADLLAQALGD